MSQAWLMVEHAQMVVTARDSLEVGSRVQARACCHMDTQVESGTMAIQWVKNT